MRGDADINTTYLIWIFKKSKHEPAIIWKRVNCQRITSKNTRPWWVDTWARDTVRWYWLADTLFWQLSIDDNIDLQSAFSWAPKVDRKCESKHWYTCGAEGQAAGGTTAVKRLNRYFCFLLLGFHLPVREKWAKMYKSVSQHNYLPIFLKILSFFCWKRFALKENHVWKWRWQ